VSHKLLQWEAKYYSVPANAVMKKDALQHDLKFWLGMRKSILSESEIWVESVRNIRRLSDGTNHLMINTSASALCFHYYEEELCGECPLAKQLEAPCDSYFGAPWQIFTRTQNPNPMILFLKRAKKALTGINKERAKA